MSGAVAVKKGRGRKKGTGIRKAIAEARDAARPTDAQASRAKRLADMVLGLVSEEAAKHPEILDVEVGGSYRKGTWLAKPEMDVDVYLRFDRGTGQDRFKDVANRRGARRPQGLCAIPQVLGPSLRGGQASKGRPGKRGALL